MTDLHTLPGLLHLTDHELARLIQDPERCEQAREALVHRYQAMVRSLALRYQLPAQYYEDLIQVGYLGLLKAINNFDPAISENLRPYAHACVSGEIKRFFRDKRWLMKVSRADQELLLSAKQAQASLTAELGGVPTDEQVADRLNVNGDDLRRAYQARQGFAPGSLDVPVSTMHRAIISPAREPRRELIRDLRAGALASTRDRGRRSRIDLADVDARRRPQHAPHPLVRHDRSLCHALRR